MQVENNCNQNSHGAAMISGNDDIMVNKDSLNTTMQHFVAIFHATHLVWLVFIFVFTQL